jgi:hypothetical protein
MTDLTDVLHRATDDLAPETPAQLLADAVRRGAGIRRRRRVAPGAAAVSGLAVACVVVVVSLGPSADSSHAPEITDQPSSRTTVQAKPPTPYLAITRDRVGSVFAKIEPGTITREHDGSEAALGAKKFQSAFDWNGYRASVIITELDRDAERACTQGVGGADTGQSCVRVRGGWSVHDVRMDAQSYNRWVSVYLDNGFHMWVLIYNSGSEKGSSSGGPPPLDVSDLEKVATSHLWFGENQGVSP